MISIEIPDDTMARLLEDGELFQIGAPQMSLDHRFSDRGFDVHFATLPIDGLRLPSVLIRSKDDGRAVAFPITQLTEATVRILADHKRGRIIV